MVQRINRPRRHHLFVRARPPLVRPPCVRPLTIEEPRQPWALATISPALGPCQPLTTPGPLPGSYEGVEETVPYASRFRDKGKDKGIVKEELGLQAARAPRSHPKSSWARFFEHCGEIPGYLTSAVGAAIVLAIRTNNRRAPSGERLLSAILSVVGAVAHAGHEAAACDAICAAVFDLFAALDRETEASVTDVLRQTIARLLDTQCESHPRRWIAVCSSIALDATLGTDASLNSTVSDGGGESEGGDVGAGSCQSGQG